MSPDEPKANPKDSSFQLTPEPQNTRHSIARVAIIIYFVTLLTTPFVLCTCPSLFAIMALCAVIALICGSRPQRIFSAVLLPLAIAGFASQIRQERAAREHIQHTSELNKQRIREQQGKEHEAQKQ